MKVLAGSLLVAAALAAAQPASAENKTYIDGIGAMKCSAIAVGLKDDPAKAANAILGWTYGYMARRNMERSAAGKPYVQYGEGSADRILNTINGFCSDKENADARLFQIADTLYNIFSEETPVA